jgi:hypothetical protein
MPNLLKKKEKNMDSVPDQDLESLNKKKHYFISIILTDKYLQSSLVENNGQGVQIREFSDIKSYFDQKDLLEQLDLSLQDLGPESEDVSDTVFAFDDSWLKDGDLDDAKKGVIKDLTEKLSLEAIGQFPIAEALAEARIIADENDSCLLLVMKGESFNLVFLKHGKLLSLVNIGRSTDMVADLQEALARANKSLDEENKYFPNKLLLASVALNQKELNKLSTALHKFDWASNPGFLQEPDIVVLEDDYMIKSISLSAGKILNNEGMKLKADVKAAKKEDEELDGQTNQVDQVPAAAIVQEPELVEPSAADNPLDFQDDEIKQANLEEEASSFGIAVDEKLIKSKFPKLKKDKKKDLMFDSEKAIETDGNTKTKKKNKKRNSFHRFFLQHKKVILIGMGIGLFSLIVLFSVFSLFFSKVKVILTPDQTLLQRSTQITLNPNIAESDFEKAILKASIENKSISGQDVQATTGISLVGEKASGKVNIFNKTDEEKEFAAGTTLTYDGINFTLDDSVKVASASETSSGSGTEYGKAEVSVTAVDIGADANINKDSKLRVSDYYDDAYSAVVLDNFSGGSSREIRVVSQEDRTDLLNSLIDKLIAEAEKEFDQDSKDGVYYLATGNTEIQDSNFSAAVGDEADSLTLDLDLDVEAIKYLSTDLKSLAVAVLQQDLADNYAFVDEEPELMTAPVEASTQSASLKLDAELMAKAVAQVDSNSLRNEILGQELQSAKEILESKSEVDAAEIVFTPAFISKIIKNLPKNANRIEFSILD